jgi:hypothetical protein
MTTKLLTFFDAAHMGLPLRSRAGACFRARAKASSPAARSIRYLSRVRAPLECRWQIDPMIGALVAIWFDPSANTGTKSVGETESLDPRRCFRQLRQAARGPVARRHVAARRAA